MANPSLSLSRGPVVAAGRAAAAPTRLRVYVMLALGIVCIALSAIFTHWSGTPGAVSAFYRVAIAAVVLTPLMARGVATGRVSLDRRVWALAAVAGIFFASDLALWGTALFVVPVATATLLANNAPIFVGLGALLLFRERLGKVYWLGLAVALAGMAVIAGHDVASDRSLGVGDLLALTAGISYAVYMLATQRIRARLDTLTSLWIPGVSGALFLLVFALATRQPLLGYSGRAYLALLAVGLISQVVGWLAINYALGHLPASVVSVTLLGQPVLTAVFAVPLLGQALSQTQLLGGAVALVGIYLVNRGFARRPTPRRNDAHPAATCASVDLGDTVRDGDDVEVRAR
jgi:drug/metabolite transporter (DMT)-like permease